jgi:hypothetical protein
LDHHSYLLVHAIGDSPTKTDSDLLMYDVIVWKDSFGSTIILSVIIVISRRAAPALVDLVHFSFSVGDESGKVLELPCLASSSEEVVDHEQEEHNPVSPSIEVPL